MGHDAAGHAPMGHDAGEWDARYAASDRVWSAQPNRTVAEIVGPWPPGRALDVGTGEGRHAVWLANLGWTVTAVDFSAVGIERGRAAAAEAGVGERIDWHVGDVRTWPATGSYDLVLVAYLHVSEDVLDRFAGSLASGGHLVIVGHALRNSTDGVGGPSDPRLLHTEEGYERAAAGLVVERLGEVLRETPEGTAIDLCLVARAR